MKIENKGYTFEERLRIREYYGIRPNPGHKYGMEWKMSEIEYQTWQAIRSSRVCKNFNPEYPVGNFFVDFGDPIKKIAIECDSKMYHHNKFQKDSERQRKIEELGWTVFRFNSRQILIRLYDRIIEKDAYEYELECQQQEEIDANAENCVECFLHSTRFRSLYENTNRHRQYNPFEENEEEEVIIKEITWPQAMAEFMTEIIQKPI